MFEEVEPWDSPVNGAELLTEMVSTIHRFVICEKPTAIAAALWCGMAWLIDYVDIAPIANITAPEKNCGKSVMLQTLGKLVPNPLHASNITPSALFRAMEQWQPTLLIDEADAFADDNEELRGVLNAGHARGTSFVVKSVAVGDGHEARQFSVWGAKAIAGIGKRAGTIESRSIFLELRRKLPNEKVERLRSREFNELFLTLRRKLARFASDVAREIATATPHIPSELQNRDADNWEPLLAIADVAGGDWSNIARKAALSLSGVRDSHGIEQELLADIQEIFDTQDAKVLFTEDLLKALNEDGEKAWATYNRGR